MGLRILRCMICLGVFALSGMSSLVATDLRLNDKDRFEMQGLSILVYRHTFHDVFRDQKTGGLAQLATIEC